MKKIEKKYFENPEKYIPKGLYCYNEKQVCPFYDKDPNKPKQENGYCHYLKIGDWEQEHLSLLWDMCKECDINDDMEYEVEMIDNESSK